MKTGLSACSFSCVAIFTLLTDSLEKRDQAIKPSHPAFVSHLRV
jgi:hypothetical protein